MKLFAGFLLFISINSLAQIKDLENPITLLITGIKEKPYEELLKDVGCSKSKKLDISCLKLNKQDTLLLFYPYEAFYENSYLFTYLKRGDSAYGTVYYDKGFTKPLQNPRIGAEWKAGFVLKYSSTIRDPICISDLLIVLEDTTLRTIDTTFFISHDPDLYFSFYFGKEVLYRVAHRHRSFNLPLIKKLEDQLWLLEKKLPKD